MTLHDQASDHELTFLPQERLQVPYRLITVLIVLYLNEYYKGTDSRRYDPVDFGNIDSHGTQAGHDWPAKIDRAVHHLNELRPSQGEDHALQLHGYAQSHFDDGYRVLDQ